MRNHTHIGLLILFLAVEAGCSKDKDLTREVQELTSGNLKFAEGPAYIDGSLFFSDIDASIIYKWSQPDGLKVFRENTGRSNGIFPGKNGDLIVCEGGNKRLVRLTMGQAVSVITDKYGTRPYNEPNDVWVSPGGNIYFTDPVYTGSLSQDGEYVYCVAASTGEVSRVASDLIKPNGITGNKSGSLLYIADYGASKIYCYDILPDGTLTNKRLFAQIQADGLDTDSNGNIYAASDGIMIYNSSGLLLRTIPVPGITTNSCIVEEGTTTLFITTHNSVFKYIIN